MSGASAALAGPGLATRPPPARRLGPAAFHGSRVFLCIVCLVAAAAPAAGQADRLSRRLDPGTAAVVLQLVDSARAASLPSEPLVRKALEGASKSAHPDEIVSATRGLLRDMQRARSALGESVAPDMLELAAAVLEAGLPMAELEELGGRSDRPGFSSGLAGILYLLSRDVPPRTAASLVASMLDAGLSHTEFATLQRSVEQDLRGGAPSIQSANVRARALIRHGPRLRPGGGEGE